MSGEPWTKQPGTWTPERVEKLKALVIEGYSAREIAKALDCGMSRNAVVGKTNRLGLKLGLGPASSPRARAQHGLPNPGYVRPKPSSVAAPKPAKPKRPTRETAMIALQVVPPTAKPWTERRGGECSWLLTEGADGIACCGPVTRGSWCANHAAVGYIEAVTPDARKRAAELYRALRRYA